MSNPLSPDFAGSSEGTVGFPSGFGDGFDAAFDQAYRVDSLLGFEAEFADRWADSLHRYAKRTGQPHNIDTSYRSVNSIIQSLVDPTNERAGANFFANADDLTPEEFQSQENLRQQAMEVNEKIKALNDPTMPSLEGILEAVMASRQEIIQRGEEASETGGITGFLGQLAGGAAGFVAGAFSGRDPIQGYMAAAGGFGSTVARRIGSEMAVNAGAEFVAQETSVQPTRQLLGEPTGGELEAVLTAGLAAGVLRGGFEGLGSLALRYADRIGVREELPSVDDPVLRQMFEASPRDPRARAGLAALDEGVAFSKANPYGETNVGYKRFEAEFTDITSFAEGRTSTAIARFLEPEEYVLENIDFDTQSVRERAPLVFEATRSTAEALREIDDRIAEVSAQIDGVGVTDAIARIDAETGELLRSFEEDLANPQLTARQRQATLKKIDQVLSSFDQPAIEKQLNDSTIALKKELQTLRKQRKAAKTRFTQARNAFDAEVVKLQTETRIKNSVVGRNVPTQPGVPTAPFNPTALRLDVVAEQARQIDTASEVHLDSDALVLKNMEAETEDGKVLVDLGDGQMVERSFVLEDPDNAGKEITAGALMKRMQEDEAMITQVKACLA